MSLYYGRKIFLFQQSFLTETAICIVERWKKEWATFLFLCAILHRKVIHDNILVFFFFCHIYRTKVVEIQEFRHHGNVT